MMIPIVRINAMYRPKIRFADFTGVTQSIQMGLDMTPHLTASN